MSTMQHNPPRAPQPVPHLSAGRILTDQRYVIGWPEGIIKVGSTSHGRRRWGTFLSRGGTMIDLANYAELGDSLQADNKTQAAHILGSAGAGYLECFAVPRTDWAAVQQLARGS